MVNLVINRLTIKKIWISINWDTPKMVCLQWKIPLKWMMTRGTPFSGNLYTDIPIISQIIAATCQGFAGGETCCTKNIFSWFSCAPRKVCSFCQKTCLTSRQHDVQYRVHVCKLNLSLHATSSVKSKIKHTYRSCFERLENLALIQAAAKPAP